MTQLPSDFLSAIATGLEALRVEESRLRELATGNDPDVLLSLRDVRGLRDRLEQTSAEEWEQGWGWSFFAPQDFAVLDELASNYRASPYRDSSELANAFVRLRENLAWYCDNCFELLRSVPPREEF